MPDAGFPEWLEAPWRCWHQLTHGRPHTLTGFAQPLGGMLLKSMPGPIPWLDIAAWCGRHGYGPSDTDWLAEIVATMDAGYLEWWRGRNAN